MCGFGISFVKSILYKRIVTKFFWDYYLNSRVCNYGMRVVIGLLQTVISVLFSHFRFKCESMGPGKRNIYIGDMDR